MTGLDRFFEGMRTSASGLAAERVRMNVIAQNIAGATITRTPEGGPYVRREVLFEPLVGPDGRYAGVKAAGISRDTKTEFVRIHDPNHAHADAQGYVTLPNVNNLREMADMITAMRSYESNLRSQQGFAQMANRALELARSN
jgi:flagellar basal-body rod protein FlgC